MWWFLLPMVYLDPSQINFNIWNLSYICQRKISNFKLITRKTTETEENPARQHITLRDIQLLSITTGKCTHSVQLLYHSKSERPWLWPFKSPKVKLDFPYMVFLFMFNSNIWPNLAPLRDIRLQNLSDHYFDLSRSLKVNVMVLLDSSYMWFVLLMFNSNIWPILAPLRDKRLQNLRDLTFQGHSRSSLTVQLVSHIWLSICCPICCPISHSLAVIGVPIFFHLSLIIRPTFRTPPTPTPFNPFFFFQRIEWCPPIVRGKASTQTEVDQMNIFEIFCKRGTHRRTPHTNAK